MRLDVHDLWRDEDILPALEIDRLWAAYALCDLDPPHRERSRFIGTGDGLAVVLLYHAPGTTVLLPCGQSEAVAGILTSARDLPPAVSLSVRDRDLEAVERRFTVHSAWQMIRMVLSASNLQPVSSMRHRVVRLTLQDLPAIQALYDTWGNPFFSPSLVEEGVYCGVWGEDGLISIAGTHVVSPLRDVAAVGGVLTVPENRGRGLATAVTHDVCATMASMGIRDIALNVREDNTPAITAYTRLGFRAWERFWEGEADLRPTTEPTRTQPGASDRL